MLNNNLPKMDDHIHPTLDDYCSFCSLYKKSVSFSSKFGRISHVILKLPKVEENRSIIFFHFWNWTIYDKSWCTIYMRFEGRWPPVMYTVRIWLKISLKTCVNALLCM